MAGRARAPLAELLEVLEPKLVAAEMEQRVLQHARMAGAEHESVAIRPLRVLRGHSQEALKERVRKRSQRHRGPRMSRVCLLHSVHRQAANGVDRQALDLALLARRRR